MDPGTEHRQLPPWLQRYQPSGEDEARDVAAVAELVGSAADPFDRTLPLHLTGSALVLDGAAERVLLRWHERQDAWLHVGGHGDAKETDPLAVALREAAEETGLDDLVPLGRPPVGPIHVVLVDVKARGEEPAHEHADVRYILVTRSPGSARPESGAAPLVWVPLDPPAGVETLNLNPNLNETLRRVRDQLARSASAGERGPP